MDKYVVLEKKIGETPLQAIERYKESGQSEVISSSAEDFWMQLPFLQGLRRKSRMSVYGDEPNVPKEGQGRQKYPPMAYAGRLDPMASGKLLILIGDECKRQTDYHDLDKEYEFSVLFGVGSDTGDVLGRITPNNPPHVPEITLHEIAHDLTGKVEFPYPHFSSKTVHGKPLHVWTLEGRLHEIEIPTYEAAIYNLSVVDFRTRTGAQIADEAFAKIETVTPVTEPSKALGRDFRRDDVRKDWEHFRNNFGQVRYTIATFKCVCSSGLYMRTLAEEIAQKLGTKGLAFGIHRTEIGSYQPVFKWGFWNKRF